MSAHPLSLIRDGSRVRAGARGRFALVVRVAWWRVPGSQRTSTRVGAPVVVTRSDPDCAPRLLVQRDLFEDLQ